ncbi:MAG TPA: succinate dehydrogenase assembly factor 2 [Methylocystis sp.]|nr:succinate dehydrogenase assembly factor 2 [Methylocystis sp.]
MSDPTKADGVPPEDSDIRRRRIKIRAWRRGLRELDILLGGFVDARVEVLTADELVEMEALLDLQDAELLSWLSGVAAPPPERDTALLRAIIAFHTHEGPIH